MRVHSLASRQASNQHQSNQLPLIFLLAGEHLHPILPPILPLLSYTKSPLAQLLVLVRIQLIRPELLGFNSEQSKRNATGKNCKMKGGRFRSNLGRAKFF